MKGLLERLRYPLGPSKAFLEIGEYIPAYTQPEPIQRGEAAVDKNEKHLKSIDNTLKDILKEMKKQERPKEPNTTNLSVRHSYVDGLEKDENGWFASVIDSDRKIPITPEEGERLRELLRAGALATLNPEGVLKKSTSQYERDEGVKYRKKPVVIEAIRYEGTLQEIVDFVGIHQTEMDEQYKLYIKTLEGDMLVSHGDYVIKGVKGEFYPCKPDIFKATYEIVEQTND